MSIISISAILDFDPSQGVLRRGGAEGLRQRQRTRPPSGGICTFSADVIPKTDFASASPDGAQNGLGPVHTVGIFRVPHILSSEQYTQKMHPMLDNLKFTALPSKKFDLVPQTKGPTKCTQGGGTIVRFQETREASRATPLRYDIMPTTPPPGLSKKDFEAKLEAVVDRLLVLPLLQRNMLKLEMLLQNELWEEQVKEFGFLPPEPIVSAAHLLAVFSDAEVQKVFDSGKELGLQSGVHGQWVQNTVMDDHGHPPLELIILRCGKSANLASVIEFAQDAEARKLLLDAKQDFTFSANSFLFTADKVTSFDRGGIVYVLAL
ncbi:hypothetical protein B0H13DRAFT_1891822 [Mycena leptocephala]|nr:hypothetical protein B0H13DRAFT_1891822 [Mycena leptocephala]